MDDTYSDVYSDTYGGSLSTPDWVSVGVLTIDSPSVAAVLSGVRMVAVSDEAVTVRLVAAAIGDAFVTIERGMPFLSVHHGDSAQAVDIDRRVSMAGDSLVGSAAVGRVQEDAPAIRGLYRWVGAVDPVSVDAGAWSLTGSSVTLARFGTGVGTAQLLDSAASQHSQLGDASIPLIAIEES